MEVSFCETVDSKDTESIEIACDDNTNEDEAEHKIQINKRALSYEHSVKKKAKKAKRKLPSAKELNNLGKVETLYHSNLFHMQTDELLKEVKVKPKWKKAMDDWLERLKDFLAEIPASERFDLTDQHWTKKLKVPIIQDPFAVKGIFQFLPPSDIRLVGSYPLDLTCLPNAAVDVCLQIPNDCWQHGDFLNHRYHRKRALYLTYIASHLRKADFIEDIYFSYQHGNHMRPVLLLSPAGKLGKRLRACLLPFPPENYFKLTRFSPTKNNVRTSWFLKDDQLEDDDECSTPHLNASVLMDMNMIQSAEFLKGILSNSSIKEGILLLKIWLRQRSLSEGFGGFSNFIVTMLVAYLLKTCKINSLVSSYQVFRSTLLALCQDKILEKGISFVKDVEMEEFQNAFQVVFIDHFKNVNFCSWLTEKMLQRVQHEAKLSLEHMDSDLSSSFDNLFLKPVSFCQKFDHIIHIVNSGNLQNTVDVLKLKNSVIDYGGNATAAVVSALENLISKALHNRILVLGRVLWHPEKWKITDFPPNPNNSEKITFGLLLNPETYNKIVDRGPPADSPEAEVFRAFWGEKSELRRFFDGGICEAVVWPGKCFSDRQKIISNILKHVLKMHAGIQDTVIEYFCDQLNVVLSLENACSLENGHSYGTGEEANLEAVSKFNELAKQLRKLKNIPLSVASVQGISSVLRYTEVFPPLPSNYKPSKKMTEVRGNKLILKGNIGLAPQWVQPLEVLLTLERSGKWPDDIEAIRYMKTAFYLKLSEELYSQFSATTAAYRDYLDILKDGYIFRISIISHKELVKLKQKLTAEGIIKINDTEESLKLENKMIHLPCLSSYIYGLHHQNNSYSSACRLAKRWISSQLLSDYISEVCIELLMAYIFLSPSPFSTPK